MSRHSTLRTFLAFCLLFCVLFSAVSCKSALSSTKEEQSTVLTIDKYAVPYEQLRYVVKNYMAGIGDAAYWTEEVAAQRSEEVFTDCFRILKEQYAIVALAEEFGVNPSDAAILDMVDTQVETIIADFGSEEAYLEALKAGYMTDSVYRFFFTVTILTDELFYAMENAGALETDEAVLTEILNGDEFVRVKQILIAEDAGDDLVENRKLAEELRARAAAGEDFDALVEEYGEDLYMFNNTDGYYLCRGVWHHAFEDTAFSLEIGEVSEVIETPAGYSILLRCEKEEAYLTDHKEDLFADYKDACFSLAIEEKAATISLAKHKNFDKYTLLTID